MSARVATARARVAAHVRTPLLMSGYALVANSLITSGLGFLFWVVAARRHSPAEVGISAALINAMVLVSDFALLGLKHGFIRFLPRAGAATKRLIRTGYIAAGVAAAVFAIPVFAAASAWTEDFRFDRPAGWVFAWFVVSSIAWVLFVLQDSVLTGLRRAPVVPAKNTVFAVAKLAAVLAFASTFPQLGPFVAWTLPTVILLPLVNLWIRRTVIPAHERRAVESEHIGLRQLVQFVAADHVATLVWLSTIAGLPLLVLGLEGAEASGYFYLTFTIAYTMFLVSSGTGMSLVAEGSVEPHQLHDYARRVARQTLMIVTPAVAIVVLGAPLILRILGQEYADEGTTALRLLTLSTFPDVIITIFVAMSRVRRRLRAVMTTYALMCSMIVGLSLLLIGSLGITGVALAWLISQTAVALYLLLGEMRFLWLPFVGGRLTAGLSRIRRSPARRAGRQLVRDVVDTQDDVELIEVFDTLNDVAVARVRTARAPSILKVAVSPNGAAGLDRNALALATLAADHAELGAARLAPSVVRSEDHGPRRFLIETEVDGQPVSQRSSDLDADHPAVTSALAVLAELHQATGRPVAVDDATLDRLVGRRTRVLADALGAPDAVDVLHRELGDRLAGSTVGIARTHGDCSPDNIFVDPSGTTVSGIVDWAESDPHGLPEVDVCQMLLACRLGVERRELGAIVVDLLEHDHWTEAERRAIDRSGTVLDRRILLLTTWLVHATDLLAKSDRYRGGSVWAHRNVHPVLDWLSARRTPSPQS